MNENEIEKTLKGLANHRRLFIIKILKKKPLSVSDIAKEIKLSLRATSRHLNTLYTCGLLDRDQKGLTVFYKCRLEKLKEISVSLTLL